jgi:uncharacterized membrane protein YhaH (DUF805 family)
VNLLSLLFSFNGRIGRGQYWIASIGLNVVYFMMLLVSGSVVGPVPSKADPTTLLGSSVLLLIAGVFMTWGGLAVQVKRFHDRGQSGWLAALPLAPAATFMWTLLEGVFAGQQPGLLFAALIPHVLVMMAIGLFFFINLGCLPGTDGPNKYDGGSPSQSPTPRTGKAPAAQAATALFSAEQAMERAIAQQALRPANANAAPMRAAAPASPLRPATPGGTPSFGRKAR